MKAITLKLGLVWSLLTSIQTFAGSNLDRKEWGIYFSNYEMVLEETVKRFNISVNYQKTDSELPCEKIRRLEDTIQQIRKFYIGVAQRGLFREMKDTKKETKEVTVPRKPRFGIIPRSDKKRIEEIEVPITVKKDTRVEILEYFAENLLLLLKDGQKKDDLSPCLLWEAYYLQNPDVSIAMKNLDENESEAYHKRMGKLHILDLKSELIPYLKKVKADLGADFEDALSLHDPRLLLQLSEHIPLPLFQYKDQSNEENVICANKEANIFFEEHYINLIQYLIGEGLNVEGSGGHSALAIYISKLTQYLPDNKRYLNLVETLLKKIDPTVPAFFPKEKQTRSLFFKGGQYFQYKKIPQATIYSYQKRVPLVVLMHQIYEPKLLEAVIKGNFLGKDENNFSKSVVLGFFTNPSNWKSPTFKQNVPELLKKSRGKIRSNLSSFKLGAEHIKALNSLVADKKDAKDVNEIDPKVAYKLEGLTLLQSCLVLIEFGKDDETKKLFLSILWQLLDAGMIDPLQKGATNETALEFGQRILRSLQEKYFFGDNKHVELTEALKKLEKQERYFKDTDRSYDDSSSEQESKVETSTPVVSSEPTSAVSTGGAEKTEPQVSSPEEDPGFLKTSKKKKKKEENKAEVPKPAEKIKPAPAPHQPNQPVSISIEEALRLFEDEE